MGLLINILREIEIKPYLDEKHQEWEKFYRENRDKLEYYNFNSIEDVENKEHEIRDGFIKPMKQSGNWPPKWDYFTDELDLKVENRFEDSYGLTPEAMKYIFRGLKKYKNKRGLNEIEISTPVIKCYKNPFGHQYVVTSIGNLDLIKNGWVYVRGINLYNYGNGDFIIDLFYVGRNEDEDHSQHVKDLKNALKQSGIKYEVSPNSTHRSFTSLIIPKKYVKIEPYNIYI